MNVRLEYSDLIDSKSIIDFAALLDLYAALC